MLAPPRKALRVRRTPHTVKLGRGFLRSHRQAEVAAVVSLLPLHFLVARHHAARVITRVRLDGARAAAGADSSAGELDADGSLAGLTVIVLGAEPGEVGDLRSNTVSNCAVLFPGSFITIYEGRMVGGRVGGRRTQF